MNHLWLLATLLTVGILTVIAAKERQQTEAALTDELDAFLDAVLA
jgi:hypothetical protein